MTGVQTCALPILYPVTDLLDDRVYERSGDELADQGLFVALPPWGCHLFAML